MSNKIKFFLVIGVGALVITAGTVRLFNFARAYPETDAMYYLFIGLSVLFFLAGVAVIIIWTSRLED
jgi:hypothetical protein